jgi:hypothetical protein
MRLLPQINMITNNVRAPAQQIATEESHIPIYYWNTDPLIAWAVLHLNPVKERTVIPHFARVQTLGEMPNIKKEDNANQIQGIQAPGALSISDIVDRNQRRPPNNTGDLI